MRRALTGGILTLLLLGPFAAQAEAAEAFARSLAELIHPQVIEPDDLSGGEARGPTDVSLRVEPHPGPHAPDLHPLRREWLGPLVTPPGPTFRAFDRRRDDPPWPSHLRSRRLASLQVFLC